MPVLVPSQLYHLVDLSALEVPFTWAKIATTIQNAPSNRSPGPDEFTSEFYKSFLGLLKEDLLRFFQEFYDHGSDLLGINTANIVLLPKKDDPTDIKDFRPISLLHSVPKLATKVMTVRLQRLIQSLIHPLQSGFLRGRCIIENFALAAELVQQARKRKYQ